MSEVELLVEEITPDAWAAMQLAGAGYCDPLSSGMFTCRLEALYMQAISAELLLVIRLSITEGENRGKVLSKIHRFEDAGSMAALGNDLVALGIPVWDMLPQELVDKCDEVTEAHPVVYVSYDPPVDNLKPTITLYKAAPSPAPIQAILTAAPEIDKVELEELADMAAEGLAPQVGHAYSCSPNGRGRPSRVQVVSIDHEKHTCKVLRLTDQSTFDDVPFERLDTIKED